jgi:hypothetical protein
MNDHDLKHRQTVYIFYIGQSCPPLVLPTSSSTLISLGHQFLGSLKFCMEEVILGGFFILKK